MWILWSEECSAHLPAGPTRGAVRRTRPGHTGGGQTRIRRTRRFRHPCLQLTPAALHSSCRRRIASGGSRAAFDSSGCERGPHRSARSASSAIQSASTAAAARMTHWEADPDQAARPAKPTARGPNSTPSDRRLLRATSASVETGTEKYATSLAEPASSPTRYALSLYPGAPSDRGTTPQRRAPRQRRRLRSTDHLQSTKLRAVAQLGRAPVSKTGGCRFDSCPPCFAQHV